jgi:hypothetical protein
MLTVLCKTIHKPEILNDRYIVTKGKDYVLNGEKFDSMSVEMKMTPRKSWLFQVRCKSPSSQGNKILKIMPIYKITISLPIQNRLVITDINQ